MHSNYIDALLDTKHEQLLVVERRADGKRIFKQLQPNYSFYTLNSKGKYKTITGQPVELIKCSSKQKLHKEVSAIGKNKCFEHDHNVVLKTLYDHYHNVDLVTPHVAFFDIETAFCKDRGFSPPNDPFGEITAISVYLKWSDELVCLALPPKSLTFAQALEQVERLPNVFLFKSEIDMIETFLTLIEDADIISGWNSESFDIPYIVNRISRIMSKDDTRRLCLWNHYPKQRLFSKYGKELVTYDLVGRVHIDSLELYRKFTYDERHSYKLDAIGKVELNEIKVPYEGNLDQLYNNDFRKFIEYSLQDTALLGKLDKKLKFIDLANAIVHENTVLLSHVLGTVTLSDQAVINEAHRRNMAVINRKKHNDNTQAAGAYVAYPKKGLHDYVGALDIKSLYPSIFRALNMGIDTIVGQLRPQYTNDYINKLMSNKKTFAAAWEGMFSTFEYQWTIDRKKDVRITIDWEHGGSDTLSGDEIYQLIFESNKPWVISANGTIFTLEHMGVIPGLLAAWYKERQQLQRSLGHYEKLESGIEINPTLAGKLQQYDVSQQLAKPDVFNLDKLNELIESNDIDLLVQFFKSNGLTVEGNKIVSTNKKHVKEQIEFWDKRQLVKKIMLNSLYGAVLNAGSRFYDHRVGQSTTLTGRQITKHMSAKVNELITNVYDHVGDSIIYGDTDSVYFSAFSVLKNDIKQGNISWSKEFAVSLYNSISEETNNSFSSFMNRAFNTPAKYGSIIQCNREIVGIKGLFITKKRYGIMLYDKENKRLDVNNTPGKLKAMGLDLRRSDTPEFVQQFLIHVLKSVLTNIPHDEILDYITEFRKEFKSMDSWKKGSPKRVNNLSSYREKELNIGNKANLPGHVRASLNYNTLRKVNNDWHSLEIQDGFKVVVCRLRSNPLNYTSIAYPVDEPHLPNWFTELPFDDDAMENSLIDEKLNNLIGVLKFDLEQTKLSNTFTNFFNFS